MRQRKTFELTAIYLMKNRWSESNYKIGISNSPERRVIEVNELYGVDAVVVACLWVPKTFDAKCSESTWHRRLSQYRTDDHGGKEWFCLTQEQVESFKTWAAQGLSHSELHHLVFVKGADTRWLLEYAKQKRESVPQVTRHPYRISLWKNKNYLSMIYKSKESNRCMKLASGTSQGRLRRRKTRCTLATPSTASKQPRQFSLTL